MGGVRCYLVVEKLEEAMPLISRIFVGFFGLLVWAIGVPMAAAAVNLDALFWNKRHEVVDLPFAVLASFVDQSNSSFLIKSHKTGQLVFITPTDDVQIDGIMYQFDRFSPEGVFLVGPDAKSVRIAMRFGNVDAIAEQTDAPQNVAKVGKSSAPQTARRDTSPIRPKTGFYQGTTPIEAVRDLAERLGVPTPISAALRSAPTKGRSRSGRPGWVLDATLPPAFFALSPFEQGDIILTVDGVSAHDVDGLMNYIEQQDRSKRYNVELQRGDRLKMIEVYVK